MPTYVYRREDGSTFEVAQRITAPALTVDAETGQRVQRVISGAGLVFKGSGFYQTDYVRKDAGKPEDGASEPKAESKGESKGETKSEPKADAAPAAKAPDPPSPPAASKD